MNKAGAILGIIAGIFGFLAAIFTLLFGGLAGALRADGASTVVGLGWGGIVFSFLVIIFGAIAFAKPKGSGIALIVSSIGGAVLGGTFVAVCMVLSLVGGVLCVMGAKNVPNTQNQTSANEIEPLTNAVQNTETQHWSTGRMVTYGLFSFFAPFIGVIAGIIGLLKEPTRKQGAILLVLALGGVVMYSAISSSRKWGASSSSTSAAVADNYAELAVTPTTPLSPSGEPGQVKPMAEPVAQQHTDVCSTMSGDIDVQCTNSYLEFEVADKELNSTYKSIAANLAPERKSALKSEQIAWIKIKEKQCDAAAEGGVNLRQIMISKNLCLEELTIQRIAYLKNFQ
jgi:uncharacterized protein YecT (DUF1311 family)